MFLKNAYAGYIRYLLNNTTVSGEYQSKGNTTMHSIGSATNSISLYPLSNLDLPLSNADKTFLWLGKGTNTPNFYDYDCTERFAYSSTDGTEGFEIKSVSNSDTTYDEGTESFCKTTTVLFRNNGTEAVNVTEIYLMYGRTGFGNTTYILYKELLDTPQTVPAGHYLEITFVRRLKDGVMTANVQEQGGESDG